MKKKPTAIPADLNRYLLTSSDENQTDLAAYVEQGAKYMTSEAFAALRDMLEPLKEKTKTIQDSERLRRRIEVLMQFFEETLGDPATSLEARQSVAFGLLYFLKGFDRIPDSIPEIGLLDDALVIGSVLDRHTTAIRAHWQRKRRVWPETL
jgi:uncharacterized membrane protein YkvA (DUF1232 family)